MTIELKTQRDVEVWNAAIEASATELDSYEYIEMAGDRIRDLKRPDIVGKRISCPKPIYKEYSTELDKVIEDEMKHKPKDIMK
jgi:hypothetical protein